MPIGDEARGVGAENSNVKIGPYLLVRRLGSGGAGIVFEAVHIETRERVAVKTVIASSAWARASLRREIAVLRSLNCPGIVRILDDGLDEGGVWYAMELLEGTSLADFHQELWGHRDHETASTFSSKELKSGHSPAAEPSGFADPATPAPRLVAGGRLDQILRLYVELCVALDFVHAGGLVHGDIKPSNLFVRKTGRPVLVDFGLSHHVTISRARLDSGVGSVGTPRYAAPERYAHRPPDQRSDIYSLGCMLYESLTGVLPNEPTPGGEVRRTGASGRIRSPSSRVEGCLPELDALVVKMLAHAPDQRPHQIGEITAVLRQLLAGPAPSPAQGEMSQMVPRLHRPRLIGRQDLIATFSRLLDQTASGRGSLVFLAGEGGIGKTFLLSEVARLASLQRARVVTGECVPLSRAKDGAADLPAPLGALTGLLQATGDMCLEKGDIALPIVGNWCGVLAAFEPSLAACTPRRAASDIAQLPLAAARDRLFAALRACLVALSSDCPLVVALDDLHWADELTLSFLSSIETAFLAKNRILIIGTYRAEEVPHALTQLVQAGSVTRVRVGELTTREIEQIVGDMLGERAPPRAVVDAVLGVSEGNPYFAAEYLRVIVADGAAFRRGDGWHFRPESRYFQGPAPVLSLETVIARRLELIPPEVRVVLEGGAVIGRTFDLALLAELMDLPPGDLAPILEIGRERELLDAAPGGYRFLHDKLRQVLYEAMEIHRRLELHRKAAFAGEKSPLGYANTHERSARIAYHFRQAGMLDKALGHLVAAGDAAMNTFAYREGISLLQATLELRERLGYRDPLEKGRLHRQIADASQGLGDLPASESHLVTAAACLGYPVPRRKTRMATALLGQVLVQAAHRILPARFAQAKGNERRRVEAARVYDRLQQVNFYRGEGLPIFYCGLFTLNIAELAQPSAELATAYANAHAVSGIIPARRLSEAYFRMAAEALRERPDPVVESYLMTLTGVYRTGDGQWDEARAALEKAVSLAQKLGFRRRMEEAVGGLGVWSFLQGRFDEASLYSTEQLESGKRGDAQTQCWGLLGRAQASLACDKIDEALIDIDRAIDLLPTLGKAEIIWAHGLRASAALARGDVPQATASADIAEGRMAETPPVAHYTLAAYWAVCEVRLAVFAKERTPAARLAAKRSCQHHDGAARIFRVAGPRSLIYRGVYLSLLGRRAKAVEAWKVALGRAGSLKMPREQVFVRRLLATGGR